MCIRDRTKPICASGEVAMLLVIAISVVAGSEKYVMIASPDVTTPTLYRAINFKPVGTASVARCDALPGLVNAKSSVGVVQLTQSFSCVKDRHAPPTRIMDMISTRLVPESGVVKVRELEKHTSIAPPLRLNRNTCHVPSASDLSLIHISEP